MISDHRLDLSKFNYKDFQTETLFNHRFYNLNYIGLFPSITTVLGNTPTEETKSWLSAWKNRVGETESQRKSKEAADRGTNVHEMLELFIRKENIIFSKYPIEHVRIFNSMKLELTKVNRVYGQEVVLYSETLKVAGRCDMIGEYKNELAIIDYKTSGRFKTALDIGDYWIQTAFYAIAHNEMFGTNIDKLIILMGVENKLPMVFKKTIDDRLIEDLIIRSDKFYENLERKINDETK